MSLGKYTKHSILFGVWIITLVISFVVGLIIGAIATK